MKNSFWFTIKTLVWFMLVASFFLPLILLSGILGVIQEWIDKFIDWVIWRI